MAFLDCKANRCTAGSDTMELRYRKQHKCSDCRFCDEWSMKCYPESDDCLPSYDLDEEDLNEPGYCDFFQPIKKETDEKQEVAK